MSPRRWLIAIASCLLATGLHHGAASLPDERRGIPSDVLLLEAILEASGADDLSYRVEAVQREIDAVVARFDGKTPSYRRARKLHGFLHRNYLRDYDPDADHLYGIVRTGRYNCVSGVLFYGLIARALGYEPRVIAYPGHVLLQISVRGRRIDVETTSPFGYDVGWLLHPAQQGGGDDWFHPDLRQHGADSHRYGEHAGSFWLVSLDEAVGFAWVNQAWHSLGEGGATRAAEQVLAARRYLPDLTQAEGVRRLLVQAFRHEYEQGRFDPAYRIAEIDVGLFPASTTSRDRILAAALKRIEAACDADAPAMGEAILAQVSRVCPSASEVSRLERRTTPLITAAAVRLGDWSLARRAAERYAAAEPDPLEATRLLDWVELRSSTETGFSGGESCATDGSGASHSGLDVDDE